MTGTLEHTIGERYDATADYPPDTILGPTPESMTGAAYQVTENGHLQCGDWDADEQSFTYGNLCTHDRGELRNWYVWRLPGETAPEPIRAENIGLGFFGHTEPTRGDLAAMERIFYVYGVEPGGLKTVEVRNGEPFLLTTRPSNGWRAVPLVGAEAELLRLRCQVYYHENKPNEAVDVEAAADRAREEERERGRQRFVEAMQALSERAGEWADEHDMCERFDEFMSRPEQAKLGLAPRNRDYNVTFEVRGTITRTVTARNETHAEEQAREAMGLSEDESYSFYGENMLLTSLNCEEVDLTD